MQSDQEPLPQYRAGLVRAFGFAFHGLKLLLLSQRNARIHAALTALAVGMGAWVRLSAAEWVGLVLAIGLVWVAEALNTAIEFVVDLVSPQPQRLAGWAKDIGAAAVLIAALVACIVGALLFLPRILLLADG